MLKQTLQHVWISCSLLLLLAGPVITKPPHIIFIAADDLGWNDLSFHGSDQIPTPNLDALAYNGVILNSHYVQSVCTPSRAALMTGKYPIRTGMQGLPMYASEPRGLPPGKILPQYLKDLGYKTHAVGKWHLGFCKEEYLPVRRGFDDHMGFWAGSTSYYDHILQDVYSDGTTLSGHDFRRNFNTTYDLDGQYATDVFTAEAVNIISHYQDNTSSPLFLYLAHLAVHAGNEGKLLEAPQEEVDKFRHIPDPNRRTYAAMVSKMDQSVGQLVAALEAKQMLNNSIIVFIGDNGAPSIGLFRNWGSNYPLRGIKATLWEGGVRGIGLIWSPQINASHRVSNELMHITDWLPTLYKAAGGNITDLPNDLDGKDQWGTITNKVKSPRREILLNIDEVNKNAAIRMDNWKLVIGTYGINGSHDGYFGESGSESVNPAYDLNNVKNSSTWQSLSKISSEQKTLSDNDISNLREKATIKCSYKGYNPTTTCNPSETKQPCLFNIDLDPCERNNLIVKYESTARILYNILAGEKRTLVPQINQPLDISGADPKKYNNTWISWLDK